MRRCRGISVSPASARSSAASMPTGGGAGSPSAGRPSRIRMGRRSSRRIPNSSARPQANAMATRQAAARSKMCAIGLVAITTIQPQSSGKPWIACAVWTAWVEIWPMNPEAPTTKAAPRLSGARDTFAASAAGGVAAGAFVAGVAGPGAAGGTVACVGDAGLRPSAFTIASSVSATCARFCGSFSTSSACCACAAVSAGGAGGEAASDCHENSEHECQGDQSEPRARRPFPLGVTPRTPSPLWEAAGGRRRVALESVVSFCRVRPRGALCGQLPSGAEFYRERVAIVASDFRSRQP